LRVNATDLSREIGNLGVIFSMVKDCELIGSF
jgi:hypothetical protein